MDAREALAAVASGKTLTRAEAEAAMGSVMAGEATPAQLGGLLAALRVRGETVDEIAGFASAMRRAAVKVTLSVADAVDIVGTGGSRTDPFNISTVASVVAAAAGAKVAKHGNRAASGKCGAADVLEALGVKIDLGPEAAARCVDEVGLAFLFAARYHPAMRHAGPVRREMGIRTVFNILGPLANPAGVRRMVLGVATPELGETMARVLGELGADHVLVVHGADGLDEISPTGRTLVWELRDGAVRQSSIDPAALGLPLASVADILSGDPAANAATVRSIVGGETGARRNAVLLNAGAALIVAGLAADLREGMATAARVIDSGGARDTLDRFIATSQRLGVAEAATA
ncbi:MAG TPA: anthranilate phosphoribosyltransferase [Candidatus Limnocylindria bacterium]|nr:anthranilate phosphoribosyltransferase [Candidatus Limnocylindria bacterium]